MNTIIQTSKQIGLLTIALTIALVANFAYGQWANPTAAPTGNNATAPINIGGDYQLKAGNLGAIDLLAGDRVRSDLYCDFDGNNCIDIADVNTGTSTGTNTPSGTASPAQWVDGADLGSNSNFEQICPAGEVLVGLRIQTIHGCPGSCSYNTGPTRKIDMLCAPIAATVGNYPATNNYAWRVAIGGCSARYQSCGNSSGTRTRTVTCQDTVSNTTVADSNCNAGTRPAGGTQGCSVNYGSCR